jgi:valyl-tRNA synthetase
MSLYKFIWGDFCSWYLEMIKPEDGQIDPQTLERTRSAYERMMTLLHPFMPFVSETIWHGLRERTPGDDCCISEWPSEVPFDQALIEMVELAQGAVVKIRESRSSKGVKEREPLAFFATANSQGAALAQHAGIRAAIAKMAYLSDFTVADSAPENCVSFLVGTSEFFLQLNEQIDTAAELDKLTKEEARLSGFVKGIEKKLGNERFVQNAPADIVDKERQKLADGQAKLENIRKAIARLQ